MAVASHTENKENANVYIEGEKTLKCFIFLVSSIHEMYLWFSS